MPTLIGTRTLEKSRHPTFSNASESLTLYGRRLIARLTLSQQYLTIELAKMTGI
jgi:hypothetical protein